MSDRAPHRLISSVAKSRRIRSAFTAAVLASLAGFALTISFAHKLAPDQFGEFAVALAAVALVVGITHAAIAEPLLAYLNDRQEYSVSMERCSLLGVLATGVVLAYGLTSSNQFLIWAAPAVLGLSIYDLIRTVAVGVGRAQFAVIQDGSYFLVSLLLSVMVFYNFLRPDLAFGIWVLSGSLIGICACLMMGLRPIPRWRSAQTSTRTSLAFGCDYVVGSGSAQVLVTVLGGLGYTTVVGAIRAGGTVMGPVTLALGTSRTLLIPHLARSRSAKTSELSAAMSISVLMGTIALPPLLFLAFLPNAIGQALLGQNWHAAQPVLPYLALEALFIVLTAAPFSGHRANLAAGRSLAVRSVLSLFRFSVILYSAITWGATAAAAAMAFAAFSGLVVWWISYRNVALTRHSRQQSIQGAG